MYKFFWRLHTPVSGDVDLNFPDDNGDPEGGCIIEYGILKIMDSRLSWGEPYG